MDFIYLALFFCSVGVSVGKLFAVNHGISKYLSKNYGDSFKTSSVVLRSLGTEYIVLAVIALFVLGTVVCGVFGYLNIGQLLASFIPGFFMALLGPNYDSTHDWGTLYYELVLPFFIFIIVSIPTLFFVNYKFIYSDFEVPKKKKLKLSFFTALANAPYEFLIPYGMIADIIIDSMIGMTF